MKKAGKLDPQITKAIRDEVFERASRPLPSVEVGGDARRGLRLFRDVLREVPEQVREDIEHYILHVRAARMGLVPLLVEGQEKFKHKDMLRPEDLPYVLAWRAAEAERDTGSAERANFALDVLKRIDAL